jgi:hypothetical protein
MTKRIDYFFFSLGVMAGVFVATEVRRVHIR